MSKATWIGPALAVLSIVLTCSLTVSGQSSLYNVPTTDVVGKKQLYIEADLDAHFDRLAKGGWQSYGFSAIYGTSQKTEIGVNGYFVRTAEGWAPVELQPNFKYQIYTNETKGVSVAGGAIAYIPVNRRALKETVVTVYGVASKQFKGEWSPRLTGGGYELVGAVRDIGDRRGFLAGVEQPIHKRVSLIGDWRTGKNRFGYTAAGLGITLTKRSYLWTAYYFGNEGRANNSLGIYYGVSF